MGIIFKEAFSTYNDVVEKTNKVNSIIREYELLLSLMEVYDSNELNSILIRAAQIDPEEIVEELDKGELLVFTMFTEIFDRMAKVFEETFNMPDLATYDKIIYRGIVPVFKEIVETIFQIQEEVRVKSSSALAAITSAIAELSAIEDEM